ncbi:unnamed protein product [Cuscuta epithymum]|uniref:Uncharacterized protein n=1 Tax=Cuscuta epithymum TaxID=186058 RepID=A0AAV0EZ50_9ASTE|nr:unnamed protein product [Cuscuta epithymum]
MLKQSELKHCLSNTAEIKICKHTRSKIKISTPKGKIKLKQSFSTKLSDLPDIEVVLEEHELCHYLRTPKESSLKPLSVDEAGRDTKIAPHIHGDKTTDNAYERTAKVQNKHNQKRRIVHLGHTSTALPRIFDT